MYYQGNILSLWGYLAELLYRDHPNEVFTRTTLANSSVFLVPMLLRFIECSAFVRENTTEALGKNVELKTMLRNLDNIINTQSIAPEYTARAMTLRLLRKYRWLGHRMLLVDLEGNMVGVSDQERILEESEYAIKMLKSVSGQSLVLAYAMRFVIEKEFSSTISEKSWKQYLDQESLVDRDDLTGTYFGLYAFSYLATDVYKDRQALPKIIRAVEGVKTLELGEWDKIFRKAFARTAFETRPIWQECRPSIPRQNVGTHRASTVPVPVGSQGAVVRKPTQPSVGRVIGEAVAKAVVKEVIKDTTGLAVQGVDSLFDNISFNGGGGSDSVSVGDTNSLEYCSGGGN
jgi:hypothetical protein